MKNVKIIFWGVFLATALSAASCSKDETPAPLVVEEEVQLQLTASETAVIVNATVSFEVTADGHTISDAAIYIDGDKIDGYQYTFEEVGTSTVIAKKSGFKDSAPLEIIINDKIHNVDIYILGEGGTESLDQYQPLYWKNGEPNEFDHESIGDMFFFGMAVAEGTVYAAGERIYSSSRATAFHWQNNNFDELTESNGFASGKDICIANGDIYIGGVKNESASVTSIVYWKNGELVTVASGALGSTGGGPIIVNGNDVYVAGVVDGVPMYWKNGNGVALEGGAGQVTSMAVADNGDVYVAGYTFGSPNLAQYWKNGERHVLGVGENPNHDSEARGIFIENNDVYVAGWEKIPRPSGGGSVSVARYWKNGEPVDLTDGTNRAEANSIFVLEGEVYVAGVEYMNRRRATYWRNGEAVRLSHEDFNGYAGDIVVVKKD